MNGLLTRYRKGWSLEQAFYTDESVLNAENKSIWSRNWLFAGFDCEIPKSGDYMVYNVLNHSAIIIRDDDGSIYAHHNTCRHRGSVICTEERGNEPNLRCPYHHWVYDKKGSLKNARMMPDEFNKEQFSLFGIHVRVVAGAIFINFSNNPPAFDAEERDLGEYLQPYELSKAKVAYRDSYELDANWKLIGENFRECYHCGPAHIEYCQVVIGANLTEPRDEVVSDQLQSWYKEGLPAGTIENLPGANHFVTRYPLRPGYKSYSLDGQPVAPLMGRHRDYNTGVVGIINYPNFWMDAVSDYLWVMRITPLDARRSRVDLTWLVDGMAEEGRDYDLERLTEFWKITGEQDWRLCENNQRGILSDRYESGPLAPVEKEVMDFHSWYLEKLRTYAAPQTNGQQ
jgi:phenylpropionate dioxygenase-like ring-hydroxylating dioxygenase large terminal subunit